MPDDLRNETMGTYDLFASYFGLLEDEKEMEEEDDEGSGEVGEAKMRYAEDEDGNANVPV